MATKFQGFGPELFAFLSGLKAHNEKAWFDAHRGDYESHVKEPLSQLLITLTELFKKDKLPLQGDAKKSLFRLNRDVRFSKDKSPYKTNAGAVLTPSGEKHSAGMLYLHFEPDASFVAMGYYMPEPADLHALRSAIADDPKAFARVVTALGKKQLELDTENSLKRTPKGFEHVDDPDTLTWVKLTSYVVVRKLEDDDVLDPKLAKSLHTFAKDGLPLLAFGGKVVKS